MLDIEFKPQTTAIEVSYRKIGISRANISAMPAPTCEEIRIRKGLKELVKSASKERTLLYSLLLS